jgi:hypothetical protein
VELVVDGITPGSSLSPRCGYFRTGEQEVTRAPQRCREISFEQMSDGVLARLRPDLSVGAALAAPGGKVRVAAAREVGAHAPLGRQCRDGS